jgi:Flp pilus assembly protein protease CpaA
MQLAFNATSWILGITPSSGGRLVSLAAALSMIHLVFYLLLSYVICKSFRSLNPSNRVVLIVGLSSVIFGIYQLSYTGLGVNNDSARYLIPGFWVLLLLGIALGMSKLSHYNLWVARFFVPILSLAICFGNFHQVLLVDKKPFQNRQKVIDFLRIDPLPVGIAGYWSSALLEAQSDFSISMYPVLPDQANCFVPYYWLINKEKILNFPKQYWIVLTNSEYLDFENSLSCNKLLKSKIKQIKKFEDFTLLKI